MFDIKTNYRTFLNLMALKARAKESHMPDFHLMVGNAEDMSSQPVMVYRDLKTQNYKTLSDPLSKIYDTENIGSDGVGTIYEPDDFVRNTYYIGEPTSAGGY